MPSLTIKNLAAMVAEKWPAKALSIALAVVLFIFHRMSTLEERFFSVPLIIRSSDNLIPAKSYPRMIRVNLKGNSNAIYSILDDDIETYIDLSKFQSPGDYRAEIKILKKGTALGIDPLQVRVDPPEIILSLDYKISKRVPLAVSLINSPESGYFLRSSTLNPTHVTIDGPLQIVSTITELYTDLVDQSGRNDDFVVQVNILNPNPLIMIRGNGVADFHGFISRSIPARQPQAVDPAVRTEGAE